MKQTRIRLEEIQKVKGQIEKQGKDKILFLTGLIHELKAPLSLIQNSFSMYFDNSKKKDKTLIAIQNNVEILYRDIINILDAEKINKAQPLYNHSTILNVSIFYLLD